MPDVMEEAIMKTYFSFLPTLLRSSAVLERTLASSHTDVSLR
jgi:hypothetical protein